MPNDWNGKLVKVGDIVNVPCKVESIVATDQYCNLTVKTLYPMPPYNDGQTITLNTKQVTVVE